MTHQRKTQPQTTTLDKRLRLRVLLAIGLATWTTSIGCQSTGRKINHAQMSSNQVPELATSPPAFEPTSTRNRPTVHTVSHLQPLSPEDVVSGPVDTASELTFDDVDAAGEFAANSNEPVSDSASRQDYPIDLTTALQLAGANHLQIALAGERIRESAARLDQAKVLWVPTINAGIGYNRHDGPIQETDGTVTNVSRQSLYAGGGPAIGSAPLSGGASGPARLFVDLSTADILFEPLAARQNLAAANHARRVAQNDNILQVGLTYQELLRAYLQVDIADEAILNSRELVSLTESFEKAGKGLAADTQRARAELQQRLHQRAGAQERVAVNSAELARLLRLDASTGLFPVDPQPIPIELVSTDTPIEALISQGMMQRPELAEHRARVAEAITRIEQEQWRPWLPHLFVGYAGAGFGGGSNSDMENFGVRGDFDALAVWQVRNMGLGNRALQRERSSQQRQACLQFQWIRDQVIAEVAQAYSRARYRKEQMEYAALQVTAAADALPLNLNGIRDGVIRPIEAQQAIAGLAAARSLYLAAVIDFNQAQLELVRALGEPPQG